MFSFFFSFPIQSPSSLQPYADLIQYQTRSISHSSKQHLNTKLEKLVHGSHFSEEETEARTKWLIKQTYS